VDGWVPLATIKREGKDEHGARFFEMEKEGERR